MDEFDTYWEKGDDYAVVNFPARSKEKRLLLKMAKDGVDGVKVIATNEDGSVVGHVPLSCILFRRPPVKMRLSDEERERRSAHMIYVNEARKTAQKSEDDILPFEV